ncbi:MAG: flagellin [Pseudomonadota bacterium]
MSFNIKDRSLELRLERHLSDAQRDVSDAFERLSSGTIFTSNEPKPSERALAEGLEFKLRGLSAAKRNVNTAINLIQTGEASLSEVSNIIQRLKEINVSAASTTLSDRDRAFLFVEYQALHDEINRIAETTEFNGIPLLNGVSDKVPERLVLRVGDPSRSGSQGDKGTDLNVIEFSELKTIVATTGGLGLRSAAEILGNVDEDGVSLDDAQEMLEPEDSDNFATVYDEAMNRLATHRALFGSIQTRLNRAIDFIDVYQENIAAAKSSIADVDYAEEAAALTESRIRLQASTAVLAQSNINSAQALNLLNTLR